MLHQDRLPRRLRLSGRCMHLLSFHKHVGETAADSWPLVCADGLASNMPDSPDHGMPPACAAARQPARPGRRAARSSAGSFTPTSSGRRRRRRRRRSLSPDPMVTTSGLLAAEMPSAEETHTCKKQKCKAATTPTSKYAGVTWHKGNKKFRATIYYLQHGDGASRFAS